MARRITGRQVRRAVEKASDGDDVAELVAVEFERRRPRIFDALTDFGALDDLFGVYWIYAPEWYRGENLGESRIQYVGRGRVGARLRAKEKEKKALVRLAERVELKVASFDVDDEDMEFVLEGIMLNEHVRLFGDLPRHNDMPGSSTVEGWRRVLRMSPGPVAVLNRYGA